MSPKRTQWAGIRLFCSLCTATPSPQKKSEKGRFFPKRTGAAVQYCSSPVKIAFGRVYCFHYTPFGGKCIKEHAGAYVFDYVLKNFSKQMYVQTIQTNTYFV